MLIYQRLEPILSLHNVGYRKLYMHNYKFYMYHKKSNIKIKQTRTVIKLAVLFLCSEGSEEMKKINIDVKQQAIIYVVQNKLNGKKYIGYSSNELEHVMNQHQNKYNKPYAGSSKLFAAMREDGIENFIYRVLSVVTYFEKEQLLKAVEKTKQIHQTEINGYN